MEKKKKKRKITSFIIFFFFPFWTGRSNVPVKIWLDFCSSFRHRPLLQFLILSNLYPVEPFRDLYGIWWKLWPFCSDFCSPLWFCSFSWLTSCALFNDAFLIACFISVELNFCLFFCFTSFRYCCDYENICLLNIVMLVTCLVLSPSVGKFEFAGSTSREIWISYIYPSTPCLRCKRTAGHVSPLLFFLF